MNHERLTGRLSDEDLERELKGALLMDAPGHVSNELRAAVSGVPDEPSVVRAGGRRRFATLRAAVAAAAAVAVIAATLGIGWTLRSGIVGPGETAAPTGQTSPSASPTQTATSPSPMATGTLSETRSTPLVAYTVIHCVPGGWGDLNIPTCTSTPWIAAGDGSGARVLPAGGTQVLGWSADGSRLLVEGGAGLVLADATGSKVATIRVPCTDTSLTGTEVAPSKYDCPGGDEFALSPDGTRVAFVRSYPNVDNSTVVAILDLNSGRSTELTATRTTNPPLPEVCNTSNKIRTCQGDDGNPRWSPDGRRIVFERQGMSPEPGATWDSAALFVVDADGRNLRRVTPTGLYAIGPSWSPDGTRLAFTNDVMVVDAGRTTVLDMKDDVYTIRLDGTGLTRLTDDGISALPNWTADGRVAFIREISPVGTGGNASGLEYWIMDADGGNRSRLGGSLAELTAAGCTTCVYVAESFSGELPRAYWQPVP